ncbi:MAG TPA: ferredoxin [Candidatus Binatia bacterium]|nr:ferredoxin [Candidatus Binatia bacterium]
MPIKIIHERWKCIGCGSCVAVDEDRWVMSDDNFADLLESVHHATPEGTREERVVQELGRSKEAEEICPVNCIHVSQD